MKEGNQTVFSFGQAASRHDVQRPIRVHQHVGVISHEQEPPHRHLHTKDLKFGLCHFFENFNRGKKMAKSNPFVWFSHTLQNSIFAESGGPVLSDARELVKSDWMHV